MFTTLFAIFSILVSFPGSARGLQINVPYPNINVTVGNSVTLLATFQSTQPLGQTLQMTWLFLEHFSQTTTTVYYLDAGVRSAAGNFLNRVTASTQPGNASITISNMQPRDTGTYSLSVLNPPDISTSSGIIHVTVLTPPSVPHCVIKGAVETGHHLSLACISETGMPRPTYQWNKVTDGVLSPTPPEMDSENGMLMIGNLTTFEEGYYRCTASNLLGNTTCEIDLHTGGAAGIIAAAILAAVLAAVIIFVVVWILVIKKRKKEKLAGTEMKSMTRASQAATTTQAAPATETLLATPPAPTNEYADANEEHAAFAAPGSVEMEVEDTPAIA